MVLCIHHGELHQPLCNENCTDARSQAKTDSKTDANPNAQTSMLYREEKRLEVPFHGPKIPPIIKINTIITIYHNIRNPQKLLFWNSDLKDTHTNGNSNVRSCWRRIYDSKWNCRNAGLAGEGVLLLSQGWN